MIVLNELYEFKLQGSKSPIDELGDRIATFLMFVCQFYI